MDVSESGGAEGSELGGGEGENIKQKTQGGPGAQGLRRIRVDVRKVLAFAKCMHICTMWRWHT
jgi:hypothetical protein